MVHATTLYGDILCNVGMGWFFSLDESSKKPALLDSSLLNVCEQLYHSEATCFTHSSLPLDSPII